MLHEQYVKTLETHEKPFHLLMEYVYELPIDSDDDESESADDDPEDDE